jgi:tetratricopeptide (TPR) repeat protein
MTSTVSDFAQYRFLVIDHFTEMRTMLRDLLRRCGATQIDVAGKGREACQQLAARYYDVVLCDYNLGTGKTGQQLLEEARVKQWIGPACAWIIVTAEKAPETVLGAIEHWPDDYLIKPVTASMLLERIGKILQRKSALSEIDRCVRQKDYQGAIALCDRKIAADKSSAGELMRWKGQMLLSIGELEQARQLFQEVLREREVDWAKVGLAKICYQERDYSAARELLEQVVIDNRAYIEAYDWLAKTLECEGETGRALRVLNKAAQLSPNSPERQKALGEIALQEGRLELAEKAFRNGMEAGLHSAFQTPDNHLGLARVYGEKKQPEEAVRLLGTLHKQFDDADTPIRAKAIEGLIYQHNQQPGKAEEAARALLGLLGSSGLASSAASLEAAALLLATDRKEEGVGLLQSVVRNNHEDSALMAKVQQAFDAAGLHEEGEHLVEVSRREAIAQMNEGVLLARDGKFPEAVAAMRRAKTAMPANARVLLNCAHVMILSMQQTGVNPALLQEAQQTLQEANALSPKSKRYMQLMALLEALGSRQPQS